MKLVTVCARVGALASCLLLWTADGMAFIGGATGPDWTNWGGNAARSGRSSVVGPEQPDVLWSGGRPSIISFQPVTEGQRVFLVRELTLPPVATPNDSPIVAMDLATGAELWTANLPYLPNEWITWIAGARDGRVYASRSNGEERPAKMYALDATTGAIVWASQEPIDINLYAGIVFALNGDLILGGDTSLKRINSVDGTTLWNTPRPCINGYGCGAVVFGDAVYATEIGVTRFDLATGARQYSTSGVNFFGGQVPLMVGTDGTIYIARANSAPGNNFFYAFQDTGASLETRWSVPVSAGVAWQFGVGPDGTVYIMGPDRTIERLDPGTGAVLNESLPVAPSGETLIPRFAIDALGRVFVANGSFADGRLFAFDADLTLRWDVAVPHINVGGPVLGRDGTLIVCGDGTDVRAYRTSCPDALCDDGNVCTDDTCDATNGCAHTNNAAPCDDGNPATNGDTCQAGVCSGWSCQLTPRPKSSGYYKKLCKDGHGHPSHGDALTDADALCVGRLTASFAGFSTVDDLCDVYAHDSDGTHHDSNGPQGKECQKAEAEVMALALNICRGYVCDSQEVDSECSGGPQNHAATTAGASLETADAILADSARNKTTCKDARCLAKEINNGHGLHHTSLLLKKEAGTKVRLSWDSPVMDDGSGEASSYTIWRRGLSADAAFVAIGVTSQRTFVDETAGAISFEYEVTFTLEP